MHLKSEEWFCLILRVTKRKGVENLILLGVVHVRRKVWAKDFDGIKLVIIKAHFLEDINQECVVWSVDVGWNSFDEVNFVFLEA